MAKKKEVSIETVFDDFSALELSDQVSVFKLLKGKLEDTEKQLKTEVSLKEENIDLLSSVLNESK